MTYTKSTTVQQQILPLLPSKNIHTWVFNGIHMINMEVPLKSFTITSTSLNQFFGQEVWPDWSASGPRQLRPPILGPNQWLHITPLQPLSSVIWHLASLHEVPWGPCPLSVEAMNLFCPPQTLAQLGVSSAFQRGFFLTMMEDKDDGNYISFT